eukprot:XP_011673090.1 PREDICTED: uncharacterized protein LOC754864 [Strongylocentrotus purpuratus]
MTTLVRNDLNQPFATLSVRVHPVTWYRDICLRLEFIGCQNRACNTRLGMESGRILNEAIAASTFYYASPGHNGRLHIEESDLSAEPRPFWGARGSLARNEWLQVDLSELHTVTGIITQGAGVKTLLSWVTSYRLAYWRYTNPIRDISITLIVSELQPLTGIITQGAGHEDYSELGSPPTDWLSWSMRKYNQSETWRFYKDIEGNEMILPGNSDQNTEARNTLHRPIITRRVRIMPFEWYSAKKRMRVEIIGCPLIGTGRVCGSENGLILISGKCYASVSSNAEGACSDIYAEDSKRATVKSLNIQNELSDHRSELVFQSKTQLTIGAMKEGEEDWMWDDGTPVIYEQFLYALPVSTDAYCTAIDGLAGFKWTQYECKSALLRGSLCEIDIDECLSSENGCSHECVNYDGGYHCACPDGYRLDSSGRECVGICEYVMNLTSSIALNKGSSCFYVMESETVTWAEATNQCRAIQSRLPTVSDESFIQALNVANVSDTWVQDDLFAANDLCPSIIWNATEIIIESSDCHDQKPFICEREYADLRCHDFWSNDVTSHVTSASVGHIQAFSYPPFYNQQSTCNFLIKGPESMKVRLTIIKMMLRQDLRNSKCQDTLGVFDVIGKTNQTRGQYCGELDNVEVISQSNVVFVELTMWSLTANMPNELGFEASYDMVDCTVTDCNAVCGKTVSFHGPSGSIQTNDFPSIIPPFTSCEFNITVRSDRYISLHFNDFEIESVSANCIDRVSVRTPTGILKRALCGNKTQPLIISSSSTVIIALDTWLAGKSTGFNLVYSTTELGGCGFGRDTCSGVEYCTLSAAVFVSVNYPFPYAPNSQCRWNIVTHEGSFVTVTFTHFNVVSDINDHECTQTDYLVVYDGVNDKDPILGRFCNSNPPSNDVRSSLNVVVIEFVSDDDLQGNGFHAEYHATYTELDVDSTTNVSDYTCPGGWELFGSKCYQFTSRNQTIRWNEASKMCQNIGAFLVSIKTAKEMNLIHYMLTSSWFTGNNMKTYIGLTDNAEEGRFRWEDGGPLSYADWYIAPSSSDENEDSQPNGHEEEDCTMIKLENLRSSANWHDISCASREASQFICSQPAQADELVIPSIGDLSTKGCSSGSLRIVDTCLSLTLFDQPAPLPCQAIQSSVLLPLPRLIYVLGLLWPFTLVPVGMVIDIQGVYNIDIQTLSPLRHDVTTEPCHVMEYNGDDWQLVYRDCALDHDGSMCYFVVSDLVNICGDDMFECLNGECIRSVHVCDGREQCTGGEDEKNCGGSDLLGNMDPGTFPPCPESSFQCDMGRCISASFYCDYVPHCQDKSDEEHCTFPQCKEDEFQCSNGQCIEASQQCNITPDCVDGSDEELCSVYNVDNQTLSPLRHDVTTEPCHVMEYNGDDWQLVYRDCALAHYGSMCYFVVSDLVNICGDDMFECLNGECIRSVHVCDGREECTGGEDEKNCGGSDLLENMDPGTFPSCPESSFQCDMGQCISASFYCDYVPHCQDRSDEDSCVYPQCKDDEFQCRNGQCIEASQQCDITSDCVDGSDEELCKLCSGGTFQCYDGTCIPRRSVCDGNQDCRGLNMEDELSCENRGDDTLRCMNGENLDSRWRCLYDFDEYGLQQGCRDVTHLRNCGEIECFGNTFKCANSYCLPLRRRCDGVVDCPNGEDEFGCETYSCPGFLRCHGERYCVTDDQICDGVKDCPNGDDEMFCDIACPSGCSCDGLSFDCRSFEVWTPELAASIPTDARRL